MPPPEVVIEPLADVRLLMGLAADAEADGRAMVARFIQEWQDGRNRFDWPGERAYVAKMNGRVCGVCGLNRDPFANNTSVGRVRRLYVSVADRRNRVGSPIIERLIEDARGIFTSMHLRTYDPEASAFYEAIGFDRVDGDTNCTHRRPVVK